MLKTRIHNTFKRDVRRIEKRGKDMAELRTLMSLLMNEKPLPSLYEDHPLKGTWSGFRDVHIEPDWLLIYRIKDNELQFARTGTHADVFGW